MREDLFHKFDGLELRSEIKYLKGIGQGALTTIGSFDLELQADNMSFTITFHVVKQEELEYDAIIGNNVLKYVDILFSTKGVVFKERKS